MVFTKKCHSEKYTDIILEIIADTKQGIKNWKDFLSRDKQLFILKQDPKIKSKGYGTGGLPGALKRLRSNCTSKNTHLYKKLKTGL